jgi:hypothetical protein
MTRLIAKMTETVRHFWRTDRALTGVSLAMLPVLVASLLGLWLDPRTLLAAPLWLKPAKFAVSIAVYGLTLLWAFRHLPSASRTRRIVGRLSAGVFVIEMSIISVQAARGTPSHFNASTLLDGSLFTIMGLAIVAQTVASAFVAVALYKQKFADPVLGWALRLGLTLAIVGGSFGGLMTRPTEAQLREMQAGHVSAVGAHTVGAADGGPGLAVSGWSKQHGDLRVPHFLGLHAFQVLPLLALGLRRTRWAEQQRVRLIQVAGLSYAGLMAILLWQALRGQPLLAPDNGITAALLAWASSSLALGGLALQSGSRLPRGKLVVQ